LDRAEEEAARAIGQEPEPQQGQGGGGGHGLRTLPQRPDGSAPLSDDVEQIVTCAEVRKRTNDKRKANGTRGHTSTDQYNHAKTKWFLNFCKFAGWDFEERLVFLDPVTKEVKKGTFRRFAAYLHATPGMTKPIMKNCLAWAMFELCAQGEKHGMEFPRGYITNMAGVKALKEEVYNQARTCRVELCRDLQSEVACEIGTEKMIEVAMFLLRCGIDWHRPLANFNTLFELRATHQVCHVLHVRCPRL
jgi:hypothetical protein